MYGVGIERGGGLRPAISERKAHTGVEADGTTATRRATSRAALAADEMGRGETVDDIIAYVG